MVSPEQQRDVVLRELDRLLGVQTITKTYKALLLRDVAAAAVRMADGIDRRASENAL